MFPYIADISISDYIRRRRMSLAAVDLEGEAKVIDVALKYGYSSPTAFNRAFKSIHKTTPYAVGAGGVLPRSFPPLSFSLQSGEEEIVYRIGKKRIPGSWKIISA